MKNIPQQPQCPECERLAAVSEESNKIGDFLEWLQNKVTFCEWDDSHERYEKHKYDYTSINGILADYFNIDLDKVEKERRALLEWLREVQSGGE